MAEHYVDIFWFLFTFIRRGERLPPEMTDESKGCLKCRLTSGGGLLVGGAYVIYQSKKIKSSSRHIVTAIGCGLGILGILRIFALPPFKNQTSAEKKDIVEEREENEYIIGKFPPKLQ